MKECTQCHVTKDLSQFATRRASPDGLQFKCRACIKEYNQSYYKVNKDAIIEAVSIYYASNRDWLAPKIRVTQVTYRAKNKGRYAYHCRKRQANLLQATPKWLTREQQNEMIQLYNEASETGMQVDHIVPLQGKTVCGLHVPWNLQLLTPLANRKKNNSFTD